MEQKGAATEPFDEELQAKGCDLSFPVRWSSPLTVRRWFADCAASRHITSVLYVGALILFD